MKKLIFSSSLLFSSFMYSQSNRIIVEIDNSQKYIYESALNKLQADSYKREVLDGIKIQADNYFKELQSVADYYESVDQSHKYLLKNEIDRLKVYGYDILNLLTDLKEDKLTSTKMKHVLLSAQSQLQNIPNQQVFKELTIYKAISNFKTDIYPTSTDKMLFIMLQRESGMSENQIIDMHKNNSNKPLRDFLIEEYEKAFFINHKYK